MGVFQLTGKNSEAINQPPKNCFVWIAGGTMNWLFLENLPCLITVRHFK